MIDYERAKREGPKLKAKLTRACKVSDPVKRYIAVKQACTDAVKAWEVWGAWPDAWSNWQRALDDAAYAANRTAGTYVPHRRLEEL